MIQMQSKIILRICFYQELPSLIKQMTANACEYAEKRKHSLQTEVRTSRVVIEVSVAGPQNAGTHSTTRFIYRTLGIHPNNSKIRALPLLLPVCS